MALSRRPATLFSKVSQFLRSNSNSAAVAKSLFIRVLLLGVNFGTGVIVARSLGPSGRGEQAALALWPPFLAAMATLGIPTALNYHSRRSPEDAKRLYMGSVVTMLLVGLVASAVGAAAMPLLLHGFDAQTIREAQWLMLFAPETLLASAARAHLESRDQFARSTLGFFYPGLGTLGALVVLRLTGHLTPIAAALSYIVPPAVQAAWLIGRLWEPNVLRFTEVVRDARLLLPYGLRCFGSDVLGAISNQMDLVVIVAFLSPAELGLYTVALSLSRLINVIHASVNAILFSRASALTPDAAIDLVSRTARLATLLCIGLSIVFLLIVQVALPAVYGQAFTAALPLLTILTVEAVLGGLSWILFQGFMATGRPAIVTLVQGCWAVTALLLLFLLVPRMNITGAATALLGASIVRIGIVMAAFPLLLKRPYPNLLLNTSDIAYIRNKLRHLWVERRLRTSERAVGGGV